MGDLIFAAMAGSEADTRKALLWARSIRSFAGRFAGMPIWLFQPSSTLLPQALQDALDKLQVHRVSFTIDNALLNFPFAGKTIAAGIAEQQAQDNAAFLVWMDHDSLVIQEPLPFLLADDKVLGCRPVDHTLIGSPMADPADSFWSLVYEVCGVDARQITPMRTSVDQQLLRPYFNAGLLVVRPQRGLLQTWSNTFERSYARPTLTRFYDADFLYRIFIHQALLSGVILARTTLQERCELPHLVNYPLHMHQSYPAALRPAFLNDVITCRYDTTAGETNWDEVIAIQEPLRSWLGNRQALGVDHDRT